MRFTSHFRLMVGVVGVFAANISFAAPKAPWELEWEEYLRKSNEQISALKTSAGINTIKASPGMIPLDSLNHRSPQEPEVGMSPEEVNRFRVYLIAASKGDKIAQYNLGQCFANGTGVAVDNEAAVSWYRKSADQGHAEAQITIGSKYYVGRGVDRNYVIAIEWWKKAAEQGHPDALMLIGRSYRNGEGVEKDSVKAVEWFRKSVEKGSTHCSLLAQLYLAECYEKGEGVGIDKVEAYAYLNLILADECAASTCYPEEAREKISILEKTMSRTWFRDEVSAGQNRTKELRKEIETKRRINKSK